MMEYKFFDEFDPAIAYDFIAEFEGKKLKAYKCPAGVWTIGVGHTEGVKEGMVISEEDAIELFRADCAEFAEEASKLIKVKVNANQYIALLSFVFNFGITKFRQSSVLRNLNNGAITQAAESFLLWNKINGKPSKGLIRRRNAEKRLFMSKAR